MKRIYISKRIKDYRRENMLSQEDFAETVGVSRQAISKWEREECYPDIFFLPTLADVMGCSVDDFFDLCRRKTG